MKKAVFHLSEYNSSLRVMRYHLMQSVFPRSEKCWKHSSNCSNLPSTSSGGAISSSFDSASASVTSSVLPGINLGMRVAQPSEQFPATLSEVEPLSPNDPRVVWKEHFCSEKERPYYHNLQTNEVTYTKPHGFVTRFPRWYQRNGVQLGNEKINSVSNNSNENENSADAPHPHSKITSNQNNEYTSGGSEVGGVRNFFFSPSAKKKQLAAYGATGLLWYLIVHNVFLACVFSCIYFLNIDLVSLARSYGFHVNSDEGKIPETEKKRRPSVWQTLITAIVLNKLLVPVQILVTIGTASRAIPVLQLIAPNVKRRSPVVSSAALKSQS